jgi:periplasmic protein CpxP/Spy
MSKIKFLTISVAALLIANIAFALFFFAGRHGHRRPQEPREIIVERLHFTKEQETQYEGLILSHRSSVVAIDREILRMRNELYNHLNDSIVWPGRDSIERQLAQLQIQIEAANYDHFMAIRGLCTNEQLPLFQQLSTDIAQIFTKPPHRK